MFRLMGWVDSTAKRNGSSKSDFEVPAKLSEVGFDGRSVGEAFPGREVEGHGDLLDILFVHGIEIGLAGQPSSDTAVGILDATLLPTCVGVTEVCRRREHAAQERVPGEAGIVVEGDRAAHVRVVNGSAALGDRDVPPAFERREQHEQVGNPVAVILVVVARFLPRPHRQRPLCFGDELPAGLVEADERARGIVRAMIDLEHVLHRGDEGGVGLGPRPDTQNS